ncbi:MAG TPA: hypothetical protein VGK99_22115 [Acidobacteriota bacterium]|jgi:hypothetical protein
MGRNRTAITSFLFLIAVIAIQTLAGKDFWDAKPWTDWKREEARKILWDSPWTREVAFSPAQAQNITGERPPPTTSGPFDWTRELRYLLRWRSARAVEDARLRMTQFVPQYLNETIPAEWRSQYYILELRLFNTISFAYSPMQPSPAGEKLFKKSTFLLRKSKERIPLDTASSPSPDVIYLMFPRMDPAGQPSISAADGEVRFVTVLPNGSHLKAGFQPKKMIYRRELDL